MGIKNMYSNLKESMKQRKEERTEQKEYIRQQNKEIDKLALEEAFKEKKKQKLRLARRNIQMMANRKEKLLKERYSKKPFDFTDFILGPQTKASKKPMKQKPINKNPLDGIIK